MAGDAAILLDPPVSPETLASTITRVARDAELRRSLIERGLARVLSFDWRSTAAVTAGVYKALAG